MPDSASISAEERAQLIDYVMSLRKDYVQRLLASLGLPRSGIMVDLRSRLERALDEQPARVGQVIEFLDDSEPWGKQQVELMKAPVKLVQKLSTPAKLQTALQGTDVEELLNSPKLLAMPSDMELINVSFGDGVLEVRAVESRVYFERDPMLDFEEQSAGGLEVRYRATVRRVSRGVIALRLRPSDRSAALHISQGDRSYDYSAARDTFAELISDVLDLDDLNTVDLRPAVAKLHEAEQAALQGGPPSPTRAHRLAIRLATGARVEVTSSSADTAMVGDSVIDSTVALAKSSGTGQLGNVYFVDLPGNPLSGDDEIHAIIAAAEERVYIRNPSNKETVHYILDTVRGLC